MMKKLALFRFVSLALAIVCAATAIAADRHPELTRLSPDEEVWIDQKAKEVVVGGEIAIDKGPPIEKPRRSVREIGRAHV